MEWIVPYEIKNIETMTDEEAKAYLVEMQYWEIKALSRVQNIDYLLDEDFWTAKIFDNDLEFDDNVESWKSIYDSLLFLIRQPKLVNGVEWPNAMKRLTVPATRRVLLYMDDDILHTLYETNDYVKQFTERKDFWKDRLKLKYGNMEKVYVAFDTQLNTIPRVKWDLNLLLNGKTLKVEQTNGSNYSYNLILRPGDQMTEYRYTKHEGRDTYYMVGFVRFNEETGLIAAYTVDETRSDMGGYWEMLSEIFNYFFV